MLEMRDVLKMREYMKRTRIWLMLAGIGCIHLLMIAAVAWLVRPSDEPVPTHYTIYFGIDLIGAWWYPIAFIGMATIMSTLVFLLSFWAEKRWKIGFQVLIMQLFVSIAYLLSAATIIFTPFLFAV